MQKKAETIGKIILIILLAVISIGVIFELMSYKKNIIENSMFEVIERDPDKKVMYHKETKVMYIQTTGKYSTITVMLDSEGNPMLYEEDTE